VRRERRYRHEKQKEEDASQGSDSAQRSQKAPEETGVNRRPSKQVARSCRFQVNHHKQGIFKMSRSDVRKTIHMQGGVSIRWSVINSAYFVMWHSSVLLITPSLSEAKSYAIGIGA
jgi:hypothetical protein